MVVAELPPARQSQRRSRLGRRTTLVVAVTVLCLGVPGNTLADSPTDTHLPATRTIPVPPAAEFEGFEGDGWAIALSSDRVFNVLHHDPDLKVDCHRQTDG